MEGSKQEERERERLVTKSGLVKIVSTTLEISGVTEIVLTSPF